MLLEIFSSEYDFGWLSLLSFLFLVAVGVVAMNFENRLSTFRMQFPIGVGLVIIIISWISVIAFQLYLWIYILFCLACIFSIFLNKAHSSVFRWYHTLLIYCLMVATCNQVLALGKMRDKIVKYSFGNEYYDYKVETAVFDNEEGEEERKDYSILMMHSGNKSIDWFFETGFEPTASFICSAFALMWLINFQKTLHRRKSKDY